VIGRFVMAPILRKPGRVNSYCPICPLPGAHSNHAYEAGLQALEPKNFSGPLWLALTGINFNVVELPHPDQYSKPIAEHIANSGAYDVLDIEPAWIPALANGGVILPIDAGACSTTAISGLSTIAPTSLTIPS
jgi:multiple sugar transport system substrate-binding protein